jgi:hypothetical protein
MIRIQRTPAPRVGPEGVRVEPIVDVTKLVLATMPVWGALWAMLRAMRGLHHPML